VHASHARIIPISPEPSVNPDPLWPEKASIIPLAARKKKEQQGKGTQNAWSRRASDPFLMTASRPARLTTRFLFGPSLIIIIYHIYPSVYT